MIDIDAIIAKSSSEPAAPVETPVDPAPAEPTTAAEPVEPVTQEPTAADTPDEPETPVDPAPAEPTTAAEPVEPVTPAEPVIPTVPTELDLDEYEVDGKSINSLLDERDALAERVAKIDNDEFLKRFIAHYEATGDASAFLESQAVNWDKKDDLSVIRANFEKENSDLDPDTRELLFQEELRVKYKIDPNASPEDIDKTSDSYKIGQGLLKRDADKSRAKFKDEQKKFVIPEKPKEATVAPVDVEAQKAAYKKQLNDHPDLAKFRESKLITVGVTGEDGTKFGYEVENPNEIIEMMSDDRAFWKSFLDDKGVVNREKQAKVYAFAKDPVAYEKQLVEFGKTLAVEKTLKEKRNADGVLNKDKAPVDVASDFATGFLKAARQQKKS